MHPQSSVLLLAPGVLKAPIVALDDKVRSILDRKSCILSKLMRWHISLDHSYQVYKLVQSLADRVRAGYPSLSGCRKLTIKGDVHLSSRNVFQGEV